MYILLDQLHNSTVRAITSEEPIGFILSPSIHIELLGPTHCPIKYVFEALFPEIKRSEPEETAALSHVNADVKNAYSFIAISCTASQDSMLRERSTFDFVFRVCAVGFLSVPLM
jgi:hypothetical protein